MPDRKRNFSEVTLLVITEEQTGVKGIDPWGNEVTYWKPMFSAGYVSHRCQNTLPKQKKEENR